MLLGIRDHQDAALLASPNESLTRKQSQHKPSFTVKRLTRFIRIQTQHNENPLHKQECIPVGCVPPTTVAIHGAGVCLSAYWDTHPQVWAWRTPRMALEISPMWAWRPPRCGPGDPPPAKPLNFPPGCGPGRPPAARHAETPPEMHAGIPPPAARHAGIPPRAAMHVGILPPAARHAGIPPAMHAGTPPPPPGQNDTCKNITFANRSLRAVILKVNHLNSCVHGSLLSTGLHQSQQTRTSPSSFLPTRLLRHGL